MRRRPFPVRCGAAAAPLVAIALGLIAPASPASAAIISVDSTADTAPNAGTCVLRDALTAANGDVGVKGCAAGSASATDSIRFAPGATGTIALQSALPAVGSPVDIEGPGAAQLDLHRAAGAPAFRILTIGNDVTSTVSGVTISNGLVTGSGHLGVTVAGGGIQNRGALTLDGVEVVGNRASGTPDDYAGGDVTSQGGGIASNGSSLTIVGSWVHDNTVESSTAGGGERVFAVYGRGGGIFVSDPEVAIERSTISDNRAAATRTAVTSADRDSRAIAFGGGLTTAPLATDVDKSMVIDHSTISSNTAAVAHPADAGLADDAAMGGGLNLGEQFDNEPSFQMTASTVALNAAQEGGGILLGGGRRFGTIDGSTIASNSAASEANLGMAYDASLRSEFKLSDTIVADPEGGGLNCGLPITSLGHNLEGPNPGNPVPVPTCAFNDQTDQVHLDPQLGPLADNGGPTQTMLPLPTSPAIDRGGAGSASTDQRGEPRTADLLDVTNWPWSDGTDIGAVELQGAEATRRLTVQRSGSGSGSVAGSPAGISCPSSCATDYFYGATVTLTGTPDVGSAAAQWSGCDSVDGSNRCVVAMTAAGSVTARFDRNPPPDTKITKVEVKGKKRKATITFSGSGGTGQLHFECSLDGKSDASCRSPIKLKRLHRGKHELRVTAVDATGSPDPTPATKRFRIP